MIRLEKLLRSEMAKGVAIGVGATLLAPTVISALAPMLRPTARSATTAGLRAYERAREVLEDLVAETSASSGDEATSH